MTGLCRVVRDHAGPVEADLAFQGIDFRDFYLPGGGPGRLSWRRLLVLLQGLPYESATHSQLRADEEAARSAYQRGRIAHYAHKKALQEREAS